MKVTVIVYSFFFLTHTKRTFEWIHKIPETSDISWSDFNNWLRCGTGIYWINGKAASDKSTLMKYAHEDPRTQEAL